MLNIIKGWLGEKTTTFGLWLFLDKNVYRRIDNVIVPVHDGTTQIDHVLVSIYGIFVVETKTIKGWIFGSPGQDQWTQNLYGKKYHFQNPLRQNYRHTKCLSEYLKLDHDVFRPLVFFIGDSEFKTPMPENVLNGGLASYFDKFKQPCLTQQQVLEIEMQLQNLKAGHSISKADHIHSLKVRHKSIGTCPQCGAQLAERTVRNGPRAGSRFIGCRGFPQCEYKKNI